MTDRPVIFSPAMVLALIAGRKTQTRRLATSPLRQSDVRDRLYVREHWRVPVAYDDLSPVDLGGEEAVFYCADGGISNADRGRMVFGRHRQGMHMPRWASRLTLIVEGVRVEPLHAITSADAIAEGIEPVPGGWRDYRDGPRAIPFADTAYKFLWSSLHQAEGQRWEDNPDVLVLTFRVVRGNIDQVPA
jgi:hypothetical protein